MSERGSMVTASGLNSDPSGGSVDYKSTAGNELDVGIIISPVQVVNSFSGYESIGEDKCSVFGAGSGVAVALPIMLKMNIVAMRMLVLRGCSAKSVVFMNVYSVVNSRIG
jgi:hypothetical protein